MRPQGGNQLTTYKIMDNLPHVGQYPFIQMIMFCHAELLICATILQHHLSTAIVFLSFHIQDNEDDFSGTA
jgi:hypothetical protein